MSLCEHCGPTPDDEGSMVDGIFWCWECQYANGDLDDAEYEEKIRGKSTEA